MSDPLDRPGPGPQPRPDLSADHLPCGRPTDPLVELATTGHGGDPDALDEHQRACVHCRALLAEATRLWRPVRDLAARHEVAPPGLLDTVMRAVRALGREPLHLVLPGAGGTTRIAATVLVRIAEQAAASVPGVRLVLARGSAVHASGGTGVPGTGPTLPAVGVAGRGTVVELAVVATYGESLPDVAAQVRTTVADHLLALTTAQAITVDIYVDDVVPPLP
ncbi:Asp23/Gls24 family envelope stress response protein [Pseudokineococcus basanitobsidens]|uniref:Asp23/Gls24 family envelope stress response protein n=1 Tax=Pseudokineococcus basanitobsidens TaxID=1926649 RepID=A0ABU8RN00_9ACTN